jgi:hypothetical protein
MRLQVLDQKVESDNNKTITKKARAKAATVTRNKQKNPNLNTKTTVILSETTIKELSSLGVRGETYDDIIDRIVEYDIRISGKNPKRSR